MVSIPKPTSQDSPPLNSPAHATKAHDVRGFGLHERTDRSGAETELQRPKKHRKLDSPTVARRGVQVDTADVGWY